MDCYVCMCGHWHNTDAHTTPCNFCVKGFIYSLHKDHFHGLCEFMLVSLSEPLPTTVSTCLNTLVNVFILHSSQFSCQVPQLVLLVMSSDQPTLNAGLDGSSKMPHLVWINIIKLAFRFFSSFWSFWGHF